MSPKKEAVIEASAVIRNTNKVIDMKKIDYRTLYHQIEACILQKADSDASDFEYTPYLWVHMIDEELDVAICETNEQAVDMYSFDNLYETFFDIDTGIEHVVNAAEVHKIVRKWCLAPTAQQSRKYTIPEVFTEELLMEFCERFRDVIADGNFKGAPEINVRYAVCDTMFHVAKFGDYFFFEDKMYVFDKNPIWAPFHDEFAVKACFDKDCKLRGYAHVVAFCGIQTPYRDDKGDAIFTGDICYSTSCGNEYRVLTANKYEGYGFAGDNCMYLMDMIHEPVHRVGTIFYELSLEEPMVNTWIKGGEICNMWGQAPDIDEKLMKAKLTPSFMQDPIEYFVISNITEEYDWRIIFDAKKAIPKKKKSK